MKTSLFNYKLPEKLIASKPQQNRGESRLLVIDRADGSIAHKMYSDIPDYLSDKDIVVLNNTQVMNVRCFFQMPSGRKHEVLFTKKFSGTIWECLIRTSRKLKDGDIISLIDDPKYKISVKRQIEESSYLWLAESVTDFDFEELFDKYGHVPLPPYMKREDIPEDKVRYNTVFGSDRGSVAAPTASLNITEEFLADLRNIDVDIAEVTLNVGWGTFSPIYEEDITEHKIHTEKYSLSQSSADLINRTKSNGGRVFSFGTTATRVLETVADSQGNLRGTSGDTSLYIYPGYNWKVVDALITNFHAPMTSLLTLVSSFTGHELIMEAYQTAIREEYRFLSYGDSMLVL